MILSRGKVCCPSSITIYPRGDKTSESTGNERWQMDTCLASTNVLLGFAYACGSSLSKGMNQGMTGRH